MRTLKWIVLAVSLVVLASVHSARAGEYTNFTVSAYLIGLSGNYEGPGGCDGAALTYEFEFAGQTLSSWFPGCCGIYFDFYSPPLLVSVSPEQDYHASLRMTVPSEICCGPGIWINGLPNCVTTEVTYDSPCDNSHRPNAIGFNVQIRHTEDVVPALRWDIKDASGSGEGPSTMNGVYQLTADGMSQAIATLVNGTGPVGLEFVGDPLGCTLDGMVLTSSTNEGNIQIRADMDSSDACLVRDYYFHLQKSCLSCEAGGPCEDSTENNSVDVHFGLGPSRKDAGPAFLQIKAVSPGPELGTPASLKCNFIRPDLEIVTNGLGWIQQVRSRDRVVDVNINSSSSYSLNFYSLTNLLFMTSGFYVLTNSPYKTITVELVGGDTNHFRVSNTAKPAPADCVWQGSGWTLVTGNGLRQESKLVAQNGPVRTETRTVQNAQGAVEYQSSETWQTFAYGDRLLEKVTGSGAGARTESYTYDSNGRLQQVIHGDNSWDIYTYDALGRQVGHYQPFLNSGPTTNLSQCRFTFSSYDSHAVAGSGDDASLSPYTARLVIGYVLGKEVSRRYTVVKNGERDEIQCVTPGAPWNAPDNLVTVSYLHTDVVYLNQPSKILRPDGTMQIFTYDLAPLPGTYWPSLQRTTTLTGAPSPTGNSVTNGTRDAIWVDQFQRPALHRVTDIASQLIISQESYFYDERGHLTNTVYLDGTSVRQAYDCCRLLWRTDRDGTTTTYGYDALNRPVTTTVNGITTSNVFNANGSIVGTVRYGTDGSAITRSRSTFDDGGQLTSSVDALTNATVFTNYFDGNGQHISVTTYPDLSTRVETYATDGSLLMVTGSAVHPVRYEYGVEPEGGLPRLYQREIKLDAAGQDTQEWTKTCTDLVGRAYKTVYASSGAQPASQSFYNRQGQLARQVDPDGVATLYAYNAKGEQEYTVIDMHRDGQLHLDGTNRVTRTVSDVISNAVLGVAVRRTLVYVWPIDNADAPRLSSSTEMSLDGLRSWNVVWNNGMGVTNVSWTTYDPVHGYRVATSIAPGGSCVITTNQYGRTLSVTTYDATGAQIGQTLYGYDVHRRQNTVTDARNGVTTYNFNDADQVIGTVSPIPGPGQSAQITTTSLDAMGRVWQTTQPDNTSVTNEYYSTGELKRTHGSRTYPVEYTYDAQGRMRTMTTWTNFATAAGAATTTWNYDPYRGFLASKAYADGKGPAYAYTGAGRLQSRTWVRGILTLYSYNRAGELSGVGYSDSTPGVVYAYDRLGRQRTVAHGAAVTTITYNDAGESLSESYSGGPLDGLSVTNGYDQNLRRTNLSLLLQSPVSSLLGTLTTPLRACKPSATAMGIPPRTFILSIRRCWGKFYLRMAVCCA